MASPNPSTPTTPALYPDSIPEELKAQPAWVLWRYVQRGERWTKQPLDPNTGGAADSTDPSTWSTFQQALAVFEQCQSDGPETVAGIGFTFAPDSTYSGIDLDKCRDPETGKLAPWAVLVLRLLNSYTEVSPSGKGVKVWCRGSLAWEGGKGGSRRAVLKIPKLAALSPDGTGEIEAYTFARFFTVTGEKLGAVREYTLPATPQERTRELTALHSLCFSSDIQVSQSSATSSDGPVSTEGVSTEGEGNNLTAEEIVAKASKAKNGVKFKLLWEGKWEDAGYPSQSEADAALCSALAFWTGRDAGKMDGLFRESGLYRPKWDESRGGGNTYGSLTVSKAVAACEEVYTPPKGKSGKKAKKGDGDSSSGPVELLVELATAGSRLFHTEEGEPYAATKEGDCYRVDSSSYRRWLTGRFFSIDQTAPKAGQLDDALATLAAAAVHAGPQAPVHLRVAEHEGRVYLDLAGCVREVVEVSAQGWRVLPAAETPVYFRRPNGLLALPTPVEGGTLAELRPFLNVGGDADFRLLVVWLLAALQPRGPYPVLALHGEHGSAKSTTARVLRALIDPARAALRKEPKSPHDLFVGAYNSHIQTYENLSHIEPWLSDCLCVLATGGGFSTRRLYSNDEEQVFDVQRPIILTAINEVANRADLLDRSLVATLPPIPDDQRRREADFWRDYEQTRPAIVGALLTALSGALSRLDSIDLPSLPRMADFAALGVAAEQALGWEEGAFLEAYTANSQQANALALDSDLLVPHLRRLLEGRTCWPAEGEVKGAADLLRELTRLAGGPVNAAKLDGWPKQPVNLARRLRRLAPSLRKAGVLVEFGEREKGGERRTPVTLKVVPNE